MSFLHVVVPHESPSCCAKRRFSTNFPHQLSAHMMPQEFETSIQTINGAYNKVHAGPAFAHAGTFLLYIAGLMMVIDPQIYTSAYDSYDDNGYYNSNLDYDVFWAGWGIVLVSIIGMIFTARWMRNRRVTELNNALANTNMVYNQRGLAWRVTNAGLRSMTIEISALAPMQQIPVQYAQVHQQQQVYAAQPINLGMVNQQPYQPPYYTQQQPQQVASPSNHSVNQAPQQPQYVHTNQYPTVYPAEHAQAPLIQHQY